MNIDMNDIALYTVLVEHAKVMTELTEREYQRTESYMKEARDLRSIAKNCMDEAEQMAEKIADIIQQADTIRGKYENAGVLEDFEYIYQTYLEETE